MHAQEATSALDYGTSSGWYHYEFPLKHYLPPQLVRPTNIVCILTLDLT